MKMQTKPSITYNAMHFLTKYLYSFDDNKITVAGGRLNAHRNSGRNSGQVKRNLKVGFLTIMEIENYTILTQ